MRNFYRVAEAAAILRVSPTTIKKYVADGRLECDKTPAGQHVFTQAQLDKFMGKTSATGLAFYCRDSGGNKELMQAQEEKLRAYYGEPTLVYKDAGSGLNENRKGLWRALEAAKLGKFDRLAITAEDRLSRFGYRYLEDYFKTLGVQILVLDNVKEKSAHEELLQDFMALVASFSGRFYKIRSLEHSRLLLEKAQDELK